MSLGQNIKALRVKRKLDQAQLAQKLGVAQSSVCDWEQEKTAPRAGRLKDIARVLGVKVARLLA